MELTIYFLICFLFMYLIFSLSRSIFASEKMGFLFFMLSFVSFNSYFYMRYIDVCRHDFNNRYILLSPSDYNVTASPLPKRISSQNESFCVYVDDARHGKICYYAKSGFSNLFMHYSEFSGDDKRLPDFIITKDNLYYVYTKSSVNKQKSHKNILLTDKGFVEYGKSNIDYPAKKIFLTKHIGDTIIPVLEYGLSLETKMNKN